MKLSIVGTGYVGLVSGVCLSNHGNEVICIDIDKEKVAKINNAISPIYEEGLDALLQKSIGKTLKATTDLETSVLATDMTMIAVGTPFDGEHIDLTYIKEAAKQIGKALKNKKSYHTVIVKSTVVPGTTEDVVLPVLEEYSGKKAGKDFGVGMNPEFLKEGEAIIDFMEPDRIVFGGIDDKTRNALAELYKEFNMAEKIYTTPRTAEMIKYTANSLLAAAISFSNEISNLCTEIGVDASQVLRGVHLDKRLTPKLKDGTKIFPTFVTYLMQGCGFGGSCFPKDVKALIAYGKQKGLPMEMMSSVIEINKKQPAKMLKLLSKHFKSFKGLDIAVLGIAFKPGTDDIRESPAIPVIEELLKQGANIKAFDPVAKHEAEKVFKDNIKYSVTVEETVKNADAVLIITKWKEFLSLPQLLKTAKKQPVVVDGRRMLDKDCVKIYEGIGL